MVLAGVLGPGGSGGTALVTPAMRVTEVCDLLVGGVFPATEDRLGAIARTGAPYVGSCGALDMVDFGARPTVPPQFADPEADEALFATPEAEVRQTDRRRVERLPHHIDDPEFADALVNAWREVQK